MRTLGDYLRNGFKEAGSKTRKVIVPGVAIAAFAIPNLVRGQEQEFKIFSQKHVTALNPQGIVTGGEDPLKDYRITQEEIDEAYRTKSGNDDWYGMQVVNPFITPGIRGKGTTDYYGSGDADMDGDVDTDDLNYFKIDKKRNYRCDVNGNGVEGDEEGRNGDDQVIGKFIDGQTHYLPGQWNYLNTENSDAHDEKTEWFEKMVDLDNTNTYRDGWSCGEYANSFWLKFAGLEKPTGAQNYNYLSGLIDISTENGLYNLPVYRVACEAKNGQDHYIVGILVGKNPLNFEDWYFLEEQTDTKVGPGNFSMRNEEGDIVRVERLAYYQSPTDGKWKYSTIPVITYEFDSDGNYNLKWKNPYLVTDRPGNPITGVETNYFSQPDITGNPFPNPYSSLQGDLTIPYNSGQPESAEVYVFDNAGRLVYDSKENLSGRDRITIPGRAISKLAKGVYNVRVQNRKGMEAVRFTKL